MENYEIEVLLIEDNPNDAELTMRAFKKHNIASRIVHLKDGDEALNFIFCKGSYETRDINVKPKVILLDLKMPKVNGMEVLKAIKGDERTKSIPVVALTSSKEDPDVHECYRLGVNSYIVKPVGFENFMKAIVDLGLYWSILNNPCK